MTLISAVNPESVNLADSCQQESHPTAPTSAEELEFEETSPRRLGREWRVVVIALGVILAGVACAIIGLAFVQGSWWYSYGTDRALDHESWARIEAIRDEVAACDAAAEAIIWLNAALDFDAHPSDVRAYLLTAQEALEATGDPKLADAARELRGILQSVQSTPFWETTTPRPGPALGWPW